jgi:phenylalanyl-tRNA synthetase alpha chain
MCRVENASGGAEVLARARSLRDLSDPAAGPHAMQVLLERIVAALRSSWNAEAIVHRADPVVTVADNYDRLRYPADAVTRDARYSRYLGEGVLLRTHTSAMIPPALRSLSGRMPGDEIVLVCAGLVYRRDSIDRLHTGEPHQVDLWRLSSRRHLTTDDLRAMIGVVIGAALPGWEWRATPAEHPYTVDGLQVDVRHEAEWIEVGECGLAHPEVLAASGLDVSVVTGLAMGLGLDRLIMLAKGMDDIRLLRSEDPRIASQMLDLAAYRTVSSQPAVRRDLSLMVGAEVGAEELGDRVRESLGADAASIERVEIISETPYESLPAVAVERMGARAGQKNVLVRLVIRDVARTLTSAEANEVRNRVYRILHEGDREEIA